ncbi:alkaline phosphatase family protein [Ectothiorhodospiraceae bacterium BW-2]|nr:alkaline phosphatase family protein [Ectothiorhodospiraceae bacterium BW-2]
MDPLPPIVAGPILRHVTAQNWVVWLATSYPYRFSIELFCGDRPLGERRVVTHEPELTQLQIGQRAWISLLDIRWCSPLVEGQPIAYQLWLHRAADDAGQPLTQLLPHLCYPDQPLPQVIIQSRLNSVLHGSCRKPHHPGGDALVQGDYLLQQALEQQQPLPSLLLMSGDQIYADDVAGVMLAAIHETIELLGLWPESLQGAEVADSRELFASEYCYYGRENLLPHNRAADAVRKRLFTGVRKPIFTSDSAQNHLITLAEVVAMYLLIWSPQLWPLLPHHRQRIPKAKLPLTVAEIEPLQQFCQGLSRVQRLLAHLPVYMIFDDHDITDDWNLTAAWEQSAYGHPLSRRIIGNALIGYWLCQGWGNCPSNFSVDFMGGVKAYFNQRESGSQDKLIDQLLTFDRWNYQLATDPPLVVLDTRTQRWWSESNLLKPSGLMDWEALSELQQQLLHHQSVIMVSATPLFGVKLIEAVQKLFTLMGQSLMVDAENWMAHRGSASVILNIFRHPHTPQHFTILSGDVHYSFAYDIKLRFRKNSPDIWQITCSGLQNEFPPRLLSVLDWLNEWLYHRNSPLNWFTKRRSMVIKPRRPKGVRGRRLYNRSAIGLLRLEPSGKPAQIAIITADGKQVIFE